jgi:hypothetical protein
MQKIVTMLFLIGLFCITIFAEDTWVYQPEKNIQFAEEDSLSNIYECATDSTGNLWVISSRATSLNAVDALYKVALGDTVFTLVDEYSSDPEIHSARGITAIGNDIFVICRRSEMDRSRMYVYPDGDVAQRTSYQSETAPGYGTYIYGLSGTKDRYIYGGMIYQGVKVRVYNYSSSASTMGTYVIPDPSWTDPGGPSPTGADAIRDVATVPGGDYFNSATPIYTSRNSLPDGNQGGVTKWTGGTQDNPADYAGVALEDADSFLRWTSYVPNGITVDNQGRLWAVGTDSTRRWVKLFEVDGSWATQVNELPSSTSGDLADPAGAPFNVPEDVALSPDGNTAYVIDVGDAICYVFELPQVSVQDDHSPVIQQFRLNLVYPNPFNARTVVTYELPVASAVQLLVVNTRGELIQTLFSGNRPSGQHRQKLVLNQQPSGVYFICLTTNWGQQVQKILYLK